MYIDIEVLERLVRLAIILAFAVVGIVFCGSILRIMKQYRLNLKERNNLKLQLAIIKSQQDLNQNKKIITKPKEQFELTNDILDLIDKLIQIEASNKLKQSAMLNEKYQTINADNDIRSIADSVFDSLKKENIFNNDDIFLNNEYIMKYIAQQSSIVFLALVKNYNNEIMRNRN
jgi:hypothetical protein